MEKDNLYVLCNIITSKCGRRHNVMSNERCVCRFMNSVFIKGSHGQYLVGRGHRGHGGHTKWSVGHKGA